MSNPSKKKVVLCRVSPNFRDSKYKAEPWSLALGLHALRAFCMADNRIAQRYDIEVVAFHVKKDTAEIVAEIESRNPAIVGFSSYLCDYEKSMEVARAVRTAMPDAFIIAGGPQFFSPEEELVRNDFIDAAIAHEGELPFRDMLLAMSEDRDLESVPGIVYRKDGAPSSTAPRKELVNLADIPAFHDEAFLSRVTDTVVYQTSRGCSHACGYCAYACDKYRPFPFDRVKAELTAILQRPDIKHIIFADLDLAFSIERFESLLELFISRNTRGVEIDGFWCSLPKIAGSLKKMRRARFRPEFDISLQSVSDSVLEISNRKWFTFNQMKEIIPKILDTFPHASVELILGLPGETPETFRNDHFKLFENGIRGFNVFELMLLPGSEFYRRRDELGLELLDRVSYTLKRTPTFSEEQLAAAKRFSTNFQILSWIMNPADVPLYKEWGIDMVALADSIPNLKQFFTGDYDMGIVASEVKEEAIDALTEHLSSLSGFDSEKVVLIREYLHFRYAVDRFETNAGLDEIEGRAPEPPGLVRTFIKLQVSRRILKLIDIKTVGQSPIGDSDKTDVFAVFDPATRKAVLTCSADSSLYGQLLEAAIGSGSFHKAMSTFDKDVRPSVLPMISGLDGLKLFPAGLFDRFVRASSLLHMMLNSSDVDSLATQGVDLSYIKETHQIAKPGTAPTARDFFTRELSDSSLDHLNRFVDCEIMPAGNVRDMLKEFFQTRLRIRTFEFGIEQNQSPIAGLLLPDGFLRLAVSPRILFLLNIDENRVGLEKTGKAAVFVLYNYEHHAAAALSSKQNSILDKILKLAAESGSLENVLKSFEGAELRTARIILNRLAADGFLKTSE